MMGDSTVFIALDKGVTIAAHDAPLHQHSGVAGADGPPNKNGSGSKLPAPPASSTPYAHRFTIRLPADSTLRDLVDLVEGRDLLRPDLLPPGDGLALIDCTYHPPRRIPYGYGDAGAGRNDQKSGPDSVTLQTLGWYPGGRLVIARADDEEACERALRSNLAFVERIDGGDDGESAGGAAAAGGNEKRVVLKGLSIPPPASDGPVRRSDDKKAASSRSTTDAIPLPSQVFAAVSNRFEGVDDVANDSADGAPPSAMPTRRRRTEVERCARLDATIRNLDSSINSNKKKKPTGVSDKVRRMLIKSRSVGDKKLTEEDRFYLETVVVFDKNDGRGRGDGGDDSSSSVTSSFHFFSRLATAGRVASTCSASQGSCGADTISEFLVKRPLISDDSETSVTTTNEPGVRTSNGRYWRLPNVMPLHEAEERGFLGQFERVIVRVFVRGDAGGSDAFSATSMPTTSILEYHKVLDEKTKDGDCVTTATEEEAVTGLTAEEDTAALPTSDSNQPGNIAAKGNCSSLDDGAAGEKDSQSPSHTDTVERQRIARIESAIDLMDSTNAAGRKGPSPRTTTARKKKPASKTSEKVRQMQIKSRAKGDKKIREQDRCYLDVLSVDDVDHDATAASSSFHFFDRRESVKDILRSIQKAALANASASYNTEFLVRTTVDSPASVGERVSEQANGPSDDSSPTVLLRRAPNSATLGDLESRGLLKQFDRVIVRSYGDDIDSTERCF